jgi:hypothetical protein
VGSSLDLLVGEWARENPSLVSDADTVASVASTFLENMRRLPDGRPRALWVRPSEEIRCPRLPSVVEWLKQLAEWPPTTWEAWATDSERRTFARIVRRFLGVGKDRTAQGVASCLDAAVARSGVTDLEVISHAMRGVGQDGVKLGRRLEKGCFSCYVREAEYRYMPSEATAVNYVLALHEAGRNKEALEAAKAAASRWPHSSRLLALSEGRR